MPKDKQQADTHVYMLNGHIYFFFQYIGQLVLTGNRLVSSSKRRRRRRRKNIGLARYSRMIFSQRQRTEGLSYISSTLFDRVE
jgi:hypothetical protein